MPVAAWPTVIVQDGDGVAAIVDRYYDIYMAGSPDPFSRPLPKTAALVADLIADANDLDDRGLVVGQEITIPPLPSRPKSGQLGSAVRLFDPATQSYALVGEEGLLTTAQAALGPAAGSPWRNAGFTAVAVSAASAEILSDLGGEVRQANLVSVELLQTPNCGTAEDIFEASPYATMARAYVTNNLDSLRSAATTGPDLVLLDFDFATGHGAQVRNVVLWLLEKFGVQIELEDKVVDFELNPAGLGSVNDRDPLFNVLKGYYLFGHRQGVARDQIDSAAGWLLIADPRVGQAIHRIPPVVLQAVLWDKLNAGDWLNLSWRLQSSAAIVPVRLRDLLSDGSFVAAAAGNDRNREVLSDIQPQSLASIYNEFVNITHGLPDGTVYGNRSSVGGGGKVDLSTIGCGFSFTRQSGSSFASPLVLASAWLKHLLEGVDPGDMRRELIRASILTQPTGAVFSGGFFDPSRLIAPAQPHYLNRDRSEVIGLANVSLQTNCGDFPTIPGSPPSRDAFVYSDEGKYFLVVRHDDQQFPGIRIEPPCQLSSFRFSAETADSQLELSSPGAFTDLISHLTF